MQAEQKSVHVIRAMSNKKENEKSAGYQSPHIPHALQKLSKNSTLISLHWAELSSHEIPSIAFHNYNTMQSILSQNTLSVPPFNK